MTGEHLIYATREWVVEQLVVRGRARPSTVFRVATSTVFRVATDYETSLRNIKLRAGKHTLRTARLRVDHCARHDECVAVPDIGRSCAALQTVVYEVRVWFAPGFEGGPRRANALAGRLLHTLHIFGELVADEKGRPPPPPPFDDVTGKGLAMLQEQAPRFSDEGYGRSKAPAQEDDPR